MSSKDLQTFGEFHCILHCGLIIWTSFQELYDEAVDRTVTKCESIIFRYHGLCQREVERLKLVFNNVIESDSLIQGLQIYFAVIQKATSH